MAAADNASIAEHAPGIGTPDDMRDHLKDLQAAGVDQVIFLQQAGRNSHDHICQALDLFAKEVMPDFKAQAADREKRNKKSLRPILTRR